MSKPAASRSNRTSCRVLVVEDNAEVAWLIADVLAIDGCEATLVSTAKAARSQIDRHRWDLLVVDVTVDAESGEAVVQYAADNQPRLREATLVTTADPFTPGRREQLADLGRVVLYKPFNIDALRGLAAGLVRHMDRAAA
ncbi:MAG: response regulator [Planctomycetes bacterium]|jgi:DNA-binding NtrC family response regulator|nr:response regulator [Phycisphaerae bacterium]NBB95657.1 response regulator [Planctomycetota bacterium]